VMEVRNEIAGWLASVDTPTPIERRWRRAMWVAGPIWFIFAIGPGEVVGNNFISVGGLPPVWTWQIVWWLLGFGMRWAMAFKAGMSKTLPEQIARANNETKPVVLEVAGQRADAGASD
jgi:SSS family solute:Na+ symporter